MRLADNDLDNLVHNCAVLIEKITDGILTPDTIDLVSLNDILGAFLNDYGITFHNEASL